MISVENITKDYHVGKVEVNALRGVTLEVEEGEFLSIAGPLRFRQDYAFKPYRVSRYCHIRRNIY